VFSRTQKKKKHPLFVVSVAACAVFGAWSAVTMAKEFCKEKAKMLTKVVKKHKKCVCDLPDEDACLDD
jgi:hypothetical protein